MRITYKDQEDLILLTKQLWSRRTDKYSGMKNNNEKIFGHTQNDGE